MALLKTLFNRFLSKTSRDERAAADSYKQLEILQRRNVGADSLARALEIVANRVCEPAVLR